MISTGDVASTAGLKLDQAEDAVRALASDSQATLQVSDAGDIVYVFSPGFQETITSKSLLLRVEPVVDGEHAEPRLRILPGGAAGCVSRGHLLQYLSLCLWLLPPLLLVGRAQRAPCYASLPACMVVACLLDRALHRLAYCPWPSLARPVLQASRLALSMSHVWRLAPP
jgi:hypothetical protein